MRSVFTGHGYLLSDDRASGGKKDEADLLGCNHCQALLKRSAWAENGGMCMSCDAPVCSLCRDRIPTHGCEHFLRQLTEALETQYRRDQNMRVLGI